MATRNFENPFKDLQDAPDLISVAQRLQMLAPTPKPRLENGRQRFLAEAARLRRQTRQFETAPTTTRSLPSQASPQPTKVGFAFVLPRFQSPGLQLTAAIILVISVLLVGGAMIMLPNWSSNSVSPKLATPVMSPTYTVTPTRIALTTSPQPLFPLNNAGSSTSQERGAAFPLSSKERSKIPEAERRGGQGDRWDRSAPAPAPAPAPAHLVIPTIQLCILDMPYFNV